MCRQDKERLLLGVVMVPQPGLYIAKSYLLILYSMLIILLCCQEKAVHLYSLFNSAAETDAVCSLWALAWTWFNISKLNARPIYHSSFYEFSMWEQCPMNHSSGGADEVKTELTCRCLLRLSIISDSVGFICKNSNSSVFFCKSKNIRSLDVDEW